jgi:hypothetical protein
VIKSLDTQHPAGGRFALTMQHGAMTHMATYLSTLRAAGITLPSELSVVSTEPLAVRHRWVDGPNLLDSVTVDPARFVNAVGKITEWTGRLADTDARLDTNLANFCLADGQVVAVDVLPPLIPSARVTPSNLFETLLSALCFDTTVIRDALVGYAARALLRSSADVPTSVSDDLASLVPSGAARVDTSFPASWFRAKVVLALRALAGQITPTHVHDFFALTSVLAFRDLSEPHRRQRVRQVDHAVRELGLA